MTEREALAALAHEHWRAMLHFYDDPSNRGTNCRQCDALTLFADHTTQAEAGLDVERLRQASDDALGLFDGATREEDDSTPLYDLLEPDARAIVERLRAALATTPKEPVT